MFFFKIVFSKCKQISMYLQIFPHFLKKSLKKTSRIMQYPCQQNCVFKVFLNKESQFQKIIFLRDFDFDFDRYLSSFLTYFHACWYKMSYTFKPTWNIHLQVFFEQVCPFVTIRHERVRNCSNMIFNALRIFLMVLWSESRSGSVPNILNPVVLLF